MLSISVVINLHTILLAGGYDAVWVFVLDPCTKDKETPLQRVESVWEKWKALDVSPLQASESHEKGLKSERVVGVPGLREAMLGVNA
jgi:phosphomevalonate kinase